MALEVRSAGVSTVDGLPVSAHARIVLRGRDIPHEGKSSALDGRRRQWADLILTMTAGHKRHAAAAVSEAVDKTYTLQGICRHRTKRGWRRSRSWRRLYTEWQMRQALGGQLTRRGAGAAAGAGSSASRASTSPIRSAARSQIYEESAAEIEAGSCRKLLDRLQQRK